MSPAEKLETVNGKDRREIERMMNEQVLEVTKCPDILYDASIVSIHRLDTALYLATLNGILSSHGARYPEKAIARIADYCEMLRASGEFTLRQTDYGIKRISAAGGAMKVKYELKIKFEMVARKKE